MKRFTPDLRGVRDAVQLALVLGLARCLRWPGMGGSSVFLLAISSSFALWRQSCHGRDEVMVIGDALCRVSSVEMDGDEVSVPAKGGGKGEAGLASMHYVVE